MLFDGPICNASTQYHRSSEPERRHYRSYYRSRPSISFSPEVRVDVRAKRGIEADMALLRAPQRGSYNKNLSKRTRRAAAFRCCSFAVQVATGMLDRRDRDI